MTDVLDWSWFDLKKYEPMRNFSLEDWFNQIYARQVLYHFLFSDELKEERDKARTNKEWLKNEGVLDWVGQIQDNPVLKWNEKSLNNYYGFYNEYPFNTLSVISTPALYMWNSVTDSRFSDVWKCCESDDTNPLANTPYDLLFKQKGIRDYEQNISVIVDFSASDEQIIKDFKHWLTEFRKAIEYRPIKKNFTDKNLAKWFDWRVLPYLDVIIYAEVEQIKLTQCQIAKKIYTDNRDIDFTERVRVTTKPNAELLMRSETLDTICNQLLATVSKK